MVQGCTWPITWPIHQARAHREAYLVAEEDDEITVVQGEGLDAIIVIYIDEELFISHVLVRAEPARSQEVRRAKEAGWELQGSRGIDGSTSLRELLVALAPAQQLIEPELVKDD